MVKQRKFCATVLTEEENEYEVEVRAANKEEAIEKFRNLEVDRSKQVFNSTKARKVDVLPCSYFGED